MWVVVSHFTPFLVIAKFIVVCWFFIQILLCIRSNLCELFEETELMRVLNIKFLSFVIVFSATEIPFYAGSGCIWMSLAPSFKWALWNRSLDSIDDLVVFLLIPRHVRFSSCFSAQLVLKTHKFLFFSLLLLLKVTPKSYCFRPSLRTENWFSRQPTRLFLCEHCRHLDFH